MSEQVESKSKTKAKKPTAPKSVKRDLEVALTDTEMLKRNEELLAAMQARDDLIAQKSEATSNINASIKLAAQHVKELASALRNKKEKREVDCIERMIFPTNTVEIVRTDTGAVVEKRAMTPDERQPVLFDAPLTATVGEIAGGKAAKRTPEDVVAGDFGTCPKESAKGERCTRAVGHKGTHAYRDPSPKA